MRELHGVSLPGVAILRRAAAWLVVASLLALYLAQPLHPRLALGARDGRVVAALSPAVDGDSLPHSGAHLPGACSLCRAIGQTRVGLRAAVLASSGPSDAPGLPLAIASPAAAPRAPGLASSAPRAPPSALPVRNA